MMNSLWLLILGIIIGSILILLLVADRLFKFKVNKELEKIKAIAQSKPIKRQSINNKNSYPEPVRRYIDHIFPEKFNSINFVKFNLSGSFKLKEELPWLPTKGKLFVLTNPITRFWLQTSCMFRFLWFRVRDKYIDGKAEIFGKLLSLVPVVKVAGKEMDIASLVTVLLEAPAFPTFLFSPSVQWESIDTESAKASIEYEGQEISVVFYFNSQGEITRATSDDRYYIVDDEIRREKITTTYKEYITVNQIKIPSEMAITWNLETEDFTYARFKVEKAEFNPLH